MVRPVIFPRLLMVADGVVIGVAFVLSYFLRTLLPPGGLRPLGPPVHYLWILLIAVPLWWALLFLDGAYTPKLQSAPVVGRHMLKAGFIGLLSLTFVLFVIKFETFNRSLLLLFVAVTTILLIGFRLTTNWWLAFHRRNGRFARRALIVTSDDLASRRSASLLVDRMAESDLASVVLVGCLSIQGAGPEGPIAGLPLRGAVEELPDVLHQDVVDEVYFVVPASSFDSVTGYVGVCEEMGVDVKVLAELYRPALAPAYLEEAFGLPFFSISPTPLQAGQRAVKAVLDRIGAGMLLALGVVPMAVVALVIKLTSRGPVLFTQERCGLHGRPFVMYKFRTMAPGAEKLRGALLVRNEMSGPVFKITDDPRVTPVGRWLRRTSLDELPQLLNVLKGEMSLVGPRPLPLAEAAQIRGSLRRRFAMKPGMTCLWQCRGRSDLDFNEWMQLDLEYVDHWSLLRDLQICWKTAAAVITGHGAR